MKSCIRITRNRSDGSVLIATATKFSAEDLNTTERLSSDPLLWSVRSILKLVEESEEVTPQFLQAMANAVDTVLLLQESRYSTGARNAIQQNSRDQKRIEAFRQHRGKNEEVPDRIPRRRRKKGVAGSDF